MFRTCHIVPVISFLLSFAVLLDSCGRKDDGLREETLVSVNVVTLGSVSDTKAVNIPDGGALENGISSVQVIMFDENGHTDGYAFKDTGGTVTVRTHTGWHEVWVVTNFPASFGSVHTKAAFEATVASLSDISAGRVMHVGSTSGIVTKGWEKSIELEHFLTRVVLRKITNKMVPEALQGAEFRVLDVYLTNVPGTINLGKSSLGSVWYNKMGLQGEVDSFLHDAVPAASQVIPHNGSYRIRHSFYMLPNIQAADSRSDTWSPRHTRLVVKASVGGQVCYYPVTLPVTESNDSYEIEELVISRLGVLHEETELPFTAISFDLSLQDMAQQRSGLSFKTHDLVLFFTDMDLTSFLLENGILSGTYDGVGVMYFVDFDLDAFMTQYGNLAGKYDDLGMMYFMDFVLSVFVSEGRPLVFSMP